MKPLLTNRKALALVAALVAIALIVVARLQPAQAERAEAAAAGSGPHYTVVETEGHNLIVTEGPTPFTSTRWTRAKIPARS
jgi:hypothetical protein